MKFLFNLERICEDMGNLCHKGWFTVTSNAEGQSVLSDDLLQQKLIATLQAFSVHIWYGFYPAQVGTDKD